MRESQKKTALNLQAVQKQIEQSLKHSLNDEGLIDEIKLSETNQPLSEIFDVITLSKTWRDDPHQYAKEIARLLAARQKGNDLSSALDKLEKAMNKSK